MALIKDQAALLAQPLQHGIGARQDRVHIERQLLPGHLLALAHLELARPLRHLAPVQTHQRMRVVMLGHLPGMGLANGHAQLFDQLSAQSLLHALAGLQLAARKLPVARIRLACRAA